MSRPRAYRTEGIVLRHSELGEADRIITLVTPLLGKLRAVAKGVRRPRSKLAGHLDLLVRGNYLIAKGSNLDIITQAQILDSFLPLRESLSLVARAFYLAEVADPFFSEGEENHALYTLFLDALRHISVGEGGELPLRHFELKTLLNAGYGPELHKCIQCQDDLRPVVNFFTPKGGALCAKCRGLDDAARPISLNAQKVLRFMARNYFTAVSHLKVEDELLAELKALLGQYLRYHLEGQIKSSRFLEHVGLTKQAKRNQE